MTTKSFIDAALASETDNCIVWPFSVGSHGYGDFRDADGHHLAHRYVCRAAHGEPFDDADASHAVGCTTRLCINKRHLSWKSRAANLEDRRAAGTLPARETHCCAILTEAAVTAIRSAPRVRGIGVELARQYGVHPNTIYAVRDGRSWKL